MSDKKLSQTFERKNQKGLHVSLMARLRGYFLAGILVTAPISITIYLTWIFLTFIDGRVAAFLPEEGYNALHGATTIPGAGLIIAIVFFIVIGWFATNFLGRLVGRISEYILDRVPVINTVYKALKQVFETIIGSQAQAFREVVLIEYPRAGTWTLGFVTGVPEGEIQNVAKGSELINVFVPTAPSPVNGFLLFVPKKDIIPLKMTVEDGIKMVVSVGIITSGNGKAKMINHV